MNNEQMKQIAAITLLNARITGGLVSIQAETIEKMLLIFPEQAGAIGLLSALDQLRGHLAALQPMLDLARKELGLD
jgi:hypothetical protein